MKNPEDIIQKLVKEHDFVKDMQVRIVENHGIMLQNQIHNAENHEIVIQNQGTIIRNQEIIVNNQINIIKNQKQIVQNQVTLDVVVQTQIEVLNLLKKLSGQEESLEATNQFIEKLRETSTEKMNAKGINEPNLL